MQKITSFEPANLKILRAEIEAALAPIREKYGLHKLGMGSTKYSSGEFSATIKGELNPAENKDLKEQNESWSKLLGYSGNIVGLHFNQNGKSYRVEKLQINRPKFPIIVTCLSDGRGYKFTAKAEIKFTEGTVTYDKESNLFRTEYA